MFPANKYTLLESKDRKTSFQLFRHVYGMTDINRKKVKISKQKQTEVK